MSYNRHAIKALRRARHLNQTALAAAVGCSQGALSNIEAGRDMPSDDLALRIAAALGLDDLRAIRINPGETPEDVPHLEVD